MIPDCSTLVAPTFNLQLDCRAARPSLKSESPARISLACMTCRSRKVRCNGESPCSSCLSSNRDCFFDQARTKRRRKSSAAIYHSSKHSHYEQPIHLKYHKNKSPSIGGLSHTNSSEFSSDHRSSPVPNPTRIPYFRFLGPTAIAPGAPFREISLKVVPELARTVPQTIHQNDLDRMASLTAAATTQMGSQLTGIPAQLAADVGQNSSFNLTEEEFRRNADVFYDHMGSYLGCIRKEDLLQSLSQGKASEALKLAISALAECIQPSSSTVDYAEICSHRAKLLCLPHLSLPSLDTTFTLLLLAYCEFGREKDSGLWMWSGLAFRMATDLGLHKSPSAMQALHEPSTSSLPNGTVWDESEAGLRKRIFWSCYHLDRLISSGTGRVATLLDSEIEIDLPSLQAISPGDSLQNQMIHDPSQTTLLCPFHHLTQILILVGKISNAFNRSKLATNSCSLPASPTSDPEVKTLEHFRTELHDFYARLPPILHFTVDIARRHINVKNGPAFLLLHLWFHSLVIITHNPNSVGSAWSSLDVGPTEPLLLEISQSSVRTISDMIAFANLVDPDIVPSLPFASQPILIAGLASIPSQTSQSPNQGPAQAADWREFELCSEALLKIQTRWRGVGWLVSTLHSRARNEQDVDLSSSGSAEVSTADNSLMNKLLIRKSEPDLLSNPCRSNPKENHHFVGLTATGTFHEPASGRLSLVHQPEICCSNSIRVTNLNPHDEEQKWARARIMDQAVVNARDGHQAPLQADGEGHGRPSGNELQDQHSVGLGLATVPTDFCHQSCPATKPSHPAGKKLTSPVVSKEFALAPEPPLVSSSFDWVTQPIPQLFGPNLPGFEVFNHHKPTPTAPPPDENYQSEKNFATIDQASNLSHTYTHHNARRLDFQQSDLNTLMPYVLHTDGRDESNTYHPHHLQPLEQQPLPPPQPPSDQQPPTDHVLSLPQFFAHHTHYQQPPSPVFGKGVWDHLFRGELGILSSFHRF
ncbi:hypothetical protein PCASD_05065 [Puccinia coronata f. sp. avenae]|uniref:Zn(2)-C6 fungal-type domain-containing protein n=1 Tax=Puccinia coronata f. sp. avenae TaxID=200324 RepID=A0A2N5VG83_9BASI|nr:hypothetical protein PCASD_05065 [Puccinia coronata f. sp. avenae]